MAIVLFSNCLSHDYCLLDTVSGRRIPLNRKGEERVSLCFECPDGKSLCFNSVRYNLRDDCERKLNYRYFLADLESGRKERLFTNWDTTGVQICGVVPLGEDLLLTSASCPSDESDALRQSDGTLSHPNDSNSLCLRRYDGTLVRELLRTPCYPYGFSLSPDGTRLAFHLFDREPELNPRGVYSVCLLDSGWTRLRCLRSEAGHLLFGPEWSPDGRYLAFQDCVPAEDPGHHFADVGLIDLADESFRRLAGGPRQYFATAAGLPEARTSGSNRVIWTADGRLLHSRLSPGAHPDVHFDDTQRNHEELIYDPAAAAGGCTLGLLDPADGAFTPLTPTEDGLWAFRASLSADGTTVYYTSCRVPGAPEVRTHSLTDGSDALLTRGEAEKGADYARELRLRPEFLDAVAEILA